VFPRPVISYYCLIDCSPVRSSPWQCSAPWKLTESAATLHAGRTLHILAAYLFTIPVVHSRYCICIVMTRKTKLTEVATLCRYVCLSVCVCVCVCVEMSVNWTAGPMCVRVRAASLLLPGRVLPDARLCVCLSVCLCVCVCVEMSVNWTAGPMCVRVRAASLLLPGRVLPDARRGDSAALVDHLCLSRTDQHSDRRAPHSRLACVTSLFHYNNIPPCRISSRRRSRKVHISHEYFGQWTLGAVVRIISAE